jgi:class 3 adenylate cyclase
MSDVAETVYAKTVDGAHVAFQVLGEGPVDVVLLAEGVSELAWDLPEYERVFRRLASFSRLIRFDPRGTGLSDPLGFSDQPTLEEQAKDLLAVLGAAGCDRAAVVANGVYGLLAIFFAASYPNRTSSLVLDGCYARFERAADYPWGVAKPVLDRAVATPEDGVMYIAPSAARDPSFMARWRRLNRTTLGPTAQRQMAEMCVFSDVRPVLTAIQAPTLVLYRRGDRFAGKPHAVYLSEQIPDAKMVELPGDDNLIYIGNSDADLDEIEEFLTGARHTPGGDRVLATVLFTDIGGSTEKAAELGDRKWREVLDAHDRTIRRQLERYRGREINTLGDGFLATFDGPGRAIQCACAIRDAVRPLDIEVHTGVHTGEIETRGNDVAGIAIHLAQRVSAVASPGEVLVSRTVSDLVAGSGLDFDDRGEHELKGIPGSWRLYAVRA